MESRSETLRTLRNILAIAGVTIALLLGLSAIFQPKDSSDEAGMIDAAANGILGEPANTIDVLFIGDSEAYSAFSPLQIWGEHGITSYVCATSGQRLPYANALLRRATRSQAPRVVIIETNMAFSAFSINDLISKELEGLFPVLRFHDRWKSLTQDDLFLQPSYTCSDNLKGFRINTGIGEEFDPHRTGSGNYRINYLPATARYYLRLMVEYCRSIGATPILMNVSSSINWTSERHDAIQELAIELDVDFIDMNVGPAKVEIDWMTETFDGGDHLNLAGTQKVTSFVGEYLSTTFDLVDHRGDSGYQNWEELYSWYQEKIALAA